jgi:isopentenyl-diphosphate delta-isomerase
MSLVMRGKMESHKKALLHRAISVFVFNSNGDWLIQHAGADKYHSGGLWTNTCVGHPTPGESVLDADKAKIDEGRNRYSLRPERIVYIQFIKNN